MKVNIYFEGIDHQFTVEDDATVIDLKVQVQESFGFLVTNQRLFINGSTLLSDYNTLQSYGIVDETNISFRYKITIHGKPNRLGKSKEYELCVSDSNTVLNLKQMLDSEHEIDLRTIKFKYGNNDKLDDDTQIWRYDIRPGRHLFLI